MPKVHPPKTSLRPENPPRRNYRSSTGGILEYTFRISKEKKIEKITLSRVLNPQPPTAESYFSVSGRFFHSGSHIDWQTAKFSSYTVAIRLNIWNSISK